MFRKLAKNIGGVSAILILARGVAVISSIFLARVLSKADFGEFSLMRTLILLIAPLAIWGQDIATARFFSHNQAHLFKWDKAFKNVILIAIPMIIIAIIISNFVYNIPSFYTFLIFIASIGYCIILLISNLFRSQKQYHIAIIIDSGFRLIFFLIIVSSLVFGILTKTTAIGGYSICIPIFAIIGIVYVRKMIPPGSKPVPRQMHLDGLWLMAIDTSVILMGSVDSLFISGMLTLEALGIYSAVLVPIHAFDILGRATKFVLIPELGAQKRVHFRLYNYIIAVVAIFMLVVFVFGGKIILHILYGSKFDEGLTILQILAFVGVLRLFYSLGSSMIVGRLGQIALKFHTGLSISAVVLHIGLTYVLVRQLGMLGAAIAVLITTIFRVITSYYVVRRFRYTENELANTQTQEPGIDMAQQIMTT